MGKKNKRESTIENRVYLFKDLAAAFIAEHGALLGSSNPAEVTRARRALAEIARASCIVSDTEDLTAEEVTELVARSPERASTTEAPVRRAKKAAGPKKRARGKGRGWGGGRGGG